MNEINDMDRIVLQPGEMLLLRPRKPMTAETVQRVMEMLQNRGINAMIVDADMDMFVGVGMTTPAEPESEEPQQCAYDAVYDAYTAGAVIQYRHRDPTRAPVGEAAQWYDAHRFQAPHAFDADTYEFRLTPKKGEG